MKKYIVVSYLRIEPENPDHTTLKEAKEEKEHLEFLHPDSMFRIEEVKG